MPHIEDDVKLDFKDVLIRPKRSTLKSRSDVDLSRVLHFCNAKKRFPDDMVPILAANMDTVGTFEMANALSAHKIITCIHKHYTYEQWTDFAQRCPEVLPYVVYSSGMNVEDETKMKKV